uniref:hypothetical protein n=1 Tax=Pseudomonas sp. RW407 TaxID=2202894 RepID=UPI0011B3A195|nr:hypothetical protein [Pseudomonas sp. RW407]
MNEWILIVTLNLVAPIGEIRDVSPTILPGFHSQQTCEKAGQKIAIELINIGSDVRHQQGLRSDNNNPGAPAINTRCIFIEK